MEASLNRRLTEGEQRGLCRGFGAPDSDPGQEFERVKDYLIWPDAEDLHRWSNECGDDATCAAELKGRHDGELRRLEVGEPGT